MPTASLCTTRSCTAPSIRRLGGQLSRTLALGEKESTIEKRHLIIARVLRQQALAENIEFIDMGTDYLYPFYDGYKPTQDALQALSTNTSKALHYPSSFGLESLRQVFQRFMRARWSVDLDWKTEVMINTGASQAFDAIRRPLRPPPCTFPAHSRSRGCGQQR
jgi:DNA-binding transcriptional MocR family regulator